MTDRDGVRSPRLGYELGAENPQEARDFEETATLLALSVEPVTPPASLKADLFAKLASTPQHAPLAIADAPAADAPAADAPASTIPAATPLVMATTSRAETKARARWFARPIAIVSAAAAAVVLFAGGTFLGSSLNGNSSLAGNDSFQVQQATALAAINAAPDLKHASAPVDGGGIATLVWSGKLGQSALVASNLPALPDSKTYELWYIRDGKATAAGTMSASTDKAATWRVLSGTMTPGSTVGVTVEPSGGSKQPTTNPIVAINS